MRIKLPLIHHSSLSTRMTMAIVKVSIVWSWTIVSHRWRIIIYLWFWLLLILPPASLPSSISKIFQPWIGLLPKYCTCHKKTNHNCYNKFHTLTLRSSLTFSISELTILFTSSLKSISLFQSKIVQASAGIPFK